MLLYEVARGCWTGRQSYIVLFQATQACCVNGRGAVLPITRRWIMKMVWKVEKQHNVALMLSLDYWNDSGGQLEGPRRREWTLFANMQINQGPQAAFHSYPMWNSICCKLCVVLWFRWRAVYHLKSSHKDQWSKQSQGLVHSLFAEKGTRKIRYCTEDKALTNVHFSMRSGLSELSENSFEDEDFQKTLLSIPCVQVNQSFLACPFCLTSPFAWDVCLYDFIS